MALFYEISMEDGQKEKLTLNLGALMDLSRKDKPVVDRYFEIYKKMGNKNSDINELEMAELLYIAYRCAHAKDDQYMTMEDFLYKMTDSRVEIGNVFSKLFGTNGKKQGSPMPSGKQHQR